MQEKAKQPSCPNITDDEREPLLPLATGSTNLKSACTTFPRTTRRKRRGAVTLALIILFLILCFRIFIVTIGDRICFRQRSKPPYFKRQTPSIDLPGHIQRRWAQYSPYHTSGKYETPPDGCRVTQVHVVSSVLSEAIRSPFHEFSSCRGTELDIQSMMILKL